MGVNKKQVVASVVLGTIGLTGLFTYILTQQPTGTFASIGLVAAKDQTSFSVTDDKKIVTLRGVEGETALSLLKKHAEVHTTSSSFGAFVTSIDGLEADGVSHLWAFYINGDIAAESAQAYKAHANDRLEWRFESSR